MKDSHSSIQPHWENQQATFEKIYSTGIATYIQTLANINQAFLLKDRELRCIDERTPGGIHLAGSGILMKEEELRKALLETATTSVWTHAECGAAKLYAQQNGLDTTKADDYARAFGENLEKNFGIKYNGHINVTPSGFHVARIAYYDATGNFDYKNIAGLPPGFVISRKYIETDYALAEIKVAIAIACGGHGFGNLITKEFPFIIVPIADAHTSLESLTKELQSITQGNPLLMVSGFTAPRINLVETPISVSHYK